MSREEVKCFRCDQVIPFDFPDFESIDNLENELVVELHGGYGSFTDCIYECPAFKATLCHQCAHYLCEFLGIDAKDWHTHKTDGEESGHGS